MLTRLLVLSWLINRAWADAPIIGMVTARMPIQYQSQSMSGLYGRQR
jgi:hypothetical protein